MPWNTITTTLNAPNPFSLKATVLSHGWHECAPMSWCEGGRCFQLVERHEKKVYRISVRQPSGRQSSTRLRVSIEGDDPGDDALSSIRDRLCFMFGFHQDLSEFYELCRTHPTLHVLPGIGAGRSIRSASLVENIIKAVCGTNVNWNQAVKMINRIAQLGPILPHFRNLNAWPTPREILQAGETYLIEVCRVGYRAKSILALCEDVCEGRFDPVELDRSASSPDVSSDELFRRLKSIRGVGPTTANFLLSLLGRHDRLAIDTSTITHVARTHNHGRKPTPKQIERIYAKYGRWRNKVWWFELWLHWATAQQLLREAGFERR